MPADDEKKEENAPQKPEAMSTEGQDDNDEAIDFADLDLTVESVEERISPSETNVFDK